MLGSLSHAVSTYYNEQYKCLFEQMNKINNKWKKITYAYFCDVHNYIFTIILLFTILIKSRVLEFQYKEGFK